jgi:predicted Fe-Mo cluster-binding NifX family protein
MEHWAMKAAFSVWDNRIAPVFDVARQVLLVETKSGHIISETRMTLADTIPVQKAVCLAELDVGILICGAISRPLQDMITAYDIRIIPFVAGDLREVIGAWLAGKREIDLFAMPGCCRRKKRIWTSQGVNREVFDMRGRSGGGLGPGGGMGGGMGGGGGRGGRMGGPLAAGPGGYCVCPQCGHKEPHEVGIPCAQKQCPKCGAAMVRG